MRYNAALIIIATGRYDQFVNPLLDSARVHFLPEDNLTFFVFTDKPKDYGDDVVIIPTKHENWPGPTLHRYRTITNSSGLFKAMDYIFYVDADMLFVDKVGREILGTGLTAVLHPGFAMFPGKGSWGNNPESTSYTYPDKRKHYFAGGFSGGKRQEFLAICYHMKHELETDEINGITPEFHDETIWNKFLSERQCLVLDPSYCSPQEVSKRILWKISHLKPRLIALAKNHQEVRS